MGTEFQNKSGPDIMKTKFPGLLNEQNMDLWKDLNNVFKIELEESLEEGYLTYFDNGIVIIEVDKEHLTPAAFTHELLHVYLKAKGVEVIWDLKEKIQENKDLRALFSTSLRVHLGNCLEHVKMLPIFLSRGFKNEDFIMDYYKKILNDEQMWELEQAYFRNGKPELGMVDMYIGKFFSMRASNNPDFNYSVFFERLKQLDANLYKINQCFWEAWENYKIGDPREKYLPFLNDYLEDLKSWKQA